MEVNSVAAILTPSTPTFGQLELLAASDDGAIKRDVRGLSHRWIRASSSAWVKPAHSSAHNWHLPHLHRRNAAAAAAESTWMLETHVERGWRLHVWLLERTKPKTRLLITKLYPETDPSCKNDGAQIESESDGRWEELKAVGMRWLGGGWEKEARDWGRRRCWGEWKREEAMVGDNIRWEEFVGDDGIWD